MGGFKTLIPLIIIVILLRIVVVYQALYCSFRYTHSLDDNRNESSGIQHSF